MRKKVYAIILASGKGTRLNNETPKQFLTIADKTILEHTLDKFEQSIKTDEIILVIESSQKSKVEKILNQNKYTKITKVLNGGTTRRKSSSIGVNAVPEDDAKILIHDAARPFVSQKIINECIEALDKFNAAAAAIPATDTMIKINDKNCIESIPERKYMMNVQTPQAFNSAIIKKAHMLAETENDQNITDDCGLVLKYNPTDIYIIDGDKTNIKITYPEDISYSENIIKNIKEYSSLQ